LAAWFQEAFTALPDADIDESEVWSVRQYNRLLEAHIATGMVCVA